MPIYPFSSHVPGRSNTKSPWSLLSAFALALIALESGAQPPAGDPFLLNEGFPLGSQLRPSIAALDDGFVAVWRSDFASEIGNWSIEGRRFRADGSFIGDQFQVNPLVPGGGHDLPDVVAVSGGGFIVVWDTTNAGTDTSSSSIQARHFNVDGTPGSQMFQINAFTTGDQIAPRVAATSTGGFIVVWNSDASDGDNSGRSIRARRFDAGFNPAGAEFQVNTYTTDDQLYPVVAISPTDDFVVVWHSDGSTGGDDFDKSVQARRFTSSGSPIGNEFQVNTYTPFIQSYTSVASTADGGFIIVWTSEGSLGNDSDTSSIQARRFGAHGEPIGSEFQVNTYTTYEQLIPDIHVFPRGDFVVAWHNGEPYSARVGARQFLADGTPVADEIAVGILLQFGPRSRLRVGGSATEFVIGWDDYEYPPPADVSARGYKSAVIFTDGFESGDTSGWAIDTALSGSLR